MPKHSTPSFRAAMHKWMNLIDMPLTAQRELFLSKYDALQSLRGINKKDVRCLQSAMEVLLNLSRHKVRQDLYLNAVNNRLSLAIVQAAQLTHIPADHGLQWDCPGHVNIPEGASDFHFAVIPDDALDVRSERASGAYALVIPDDNARSEECALERTKSK